ncbi:MAG: PQQ-dependent sugar dehydrogenase [Gemmataceae bacterium]|nr:PQQ-dependent sugar dehydrogenase [Gemmataceae bacterium]
MRTRVVFIALGSLGLLMHGIISGQEPELVKNPPTEFECRFTEAAITIDGKDDEPAWKSAQLIDTFYQPWLGEKARRAKTSTKAKLLWDREHLYFFADLEDHDLYATVKEHDGMTWNDDVFELFFRPAQDKPGYYEFQVNAAGTMLDMFLPKRGPDGYARYAKEGDFHMQSKVRLRGTLNQRGDRDEGWSVEGKIPWKDFARTGGRPEAGERWKFALCRYDYSKEWKTPELSTCAPLKSKTKPDFHLIDDYATLRFTKSDKKTGLYDKRIPLTTSKVIGSPDPPLPYRVVRTYPNLKIPHLIGATHQPGSDRILFIYSPKSAGYGPTTICRSKDTADVKEFETLLELTDTAYDIAFHPKFADNGYFYVGSNGSRDKGPKMTRVTRYTMERPKAGQVENLSYNVDPKSALVIIEWESDGHNGAAVAFGHDGMLYVTSGDGTSDSDTTIVGQDMSTLLAKVLRIDVDRPAPGRAYSVPKDNPFVDLKDARPEIWALGLRNPWRMTVDQKTGHIWVAQNGQDLYEQAFLVKKGDNYGWSVTEGSQPFYPTRKKGPNFFTKPTVEHPHSEARSLTGGLVYYGKKYPELTGAYIYGDYSTGRIWAIKHDGQKILWHKEICDSRLAITGFVTDSQGEIMVLDFQPNSGFYAFEPTPNKLPSPSGTFPRKLSDSGLFRSVKGHVMEPALVPYSVNAVLYSDGANKERWLGIPGDGKIEFTTSRGWNFPDETVIVKSFHLDFEDSNPASRKWIETRFLTKQAGQWYGYSYAWNDEQTEGFLVEGAGKDREYFIKTKKGDMRKQTWHYPSRTECMVCHSRAANWVLGLTEVQMNKVHEQGGVPSAPTPLPKGEGSLQVNENQLAMFERLGLFQSMNYWEDLRNQLREEAKAKGLKDEEANKAVDKQLDTSGQRQPKTMSSMLPRTPESYRKLVDPYDKKQDLTLRARSYLHSNCAQCHVEAGGGNAQMELEFTTPLEKMRLIGVKPVHDTYGIADAKLVYPGHPEKSILLHRISHRDKGHMPPLATSLVDQATVELMREWILHLK